MNKRKIKKIIFITYISKLNPETKILLDNLSGHKEFLIIDN